MLRGAGLWECADVIELLGKWIPEDRKVIVLESGAGLWSGVRKNELPKNHVILRYDTPGANEVSLADIAKTALSMAGDYLILPDLDLRYYEIFQQHIAPNFQGIIVGVHGLDSRFRSIADIMIELAARHVAPPLGIRSVWARRIYPLEAIPAQGAGPHFTMSAAGQINQAPASAVTVTDNDIRRIRQFLPLVRQSADDLSARLNSNDNAFTELVRDLAQYHSAISRAESEIDWGLVWGFGVLLEETAAAAERQISNRLAPVLEDADLAALQSLRALHAPLILATVEGRELQEQADRLRMTREEQAALQTDAIAVSVNLNQNEEIIIEPDAAAIVEAAAAGIGEGRHPERGTTFGIAGIKNILTVLTRIIHRTARNRPRPPNTWARDFIAKNFIKQPIRIVVSDSNGLALIAHFS